MWQQGAIEECSNTVLLVAKAILAMTDHGFHHGAMHKLIRAGMTNEVFNCLSV